MKFLSVFLLSITVFAGFAQPARLIEIKSRTKNHQQTNLKSLEAKFTADVTQGVSPLSVNFTDQSTGNPTSWKWNFGDGDSSALQNPSHIYQANGFNSGYYTVKLTISDGASSYALEKLDYIRVVPDYVNCDTLRFPLPEPLTYYYLPNGDGFVSGNNIYGDRAVCDYFGNAQSDFTITGAILDLSVAKRAAASNEKIPVCIWNSNGLNGNPGDLLLSDSVLLSSLADDVAKQRLSVINFAEPLHFYDNFYIGIHLPVVSGDTVAFWSTGTGKVSVNTGWILTKTDGWQSAQTLYTPQGGPSFLISNAIYPKICRVIGIDEKTMPVPFAIWPNPASDIITLVNQEGNSGVSRYSVFDAMGRFVLSGDLSGPIATEINIGSLKTGVYILKVHGKNAPFSMRFIKY